MFSEILILNPNSFHNPTMTLTFHSNFVLPIKY